MNQMITMCLGMVILAFLIPSQVYSETAAKSNVTNVTAVNSTSTLPNLNAGLPPVPTNTTTPHSHADSLYTSFAFLLSVTSIFLLKLFC